MVRLAVTTRAETFERLGATLPDRGIEVRHFRTEGRTLALSEPPWEPGEFDVGLVYPSRLMEGGVVDALLDVPWVNDREAVLTSRNKGEVLARLIRAGIPVPETVVVSNPVSRRELRTVFERFDPPVVVKPNSTTRGTGITLAGDLDTFLGICDYLGLVHDFPATGDKSFLVQEFLPDARDYRAMVLEGEYVGAVEREGTGWKHNVHAGARATGVTLPEDLRDLAERVARTLGIPFLGVDLLVSGDRAVVSETNARPTVDDATKYEPDFDDRLAALIRARAQE
ncbi:ATP-grasp domain-containing protein [Halalkalicoccus jeotgali]|uniref:RimK domain protein ATP-grasp n=1 Tax=Halalkalicoccus jeotgali (strain DSM 18796 / CECT 7217 / JCM 14584 / KCTC 4019 / B3) TaxID=795797 RepID=D8J927_HALJB|nr:RimK family alpha-L-glutamate ligase [Halalkalicoccus jeotgali]ADJ16296.1 RimK domain protein ATP-grasp [Halalkalicoccus jeotgali B3]ELY37030.1 RimK domain-containing protein ATP-grasp [Halalkalicoccus jeotgali B3]